MILGFFIQLCKKRSVSRAIGEGGEMCLLYISRGHKIGSERLKQDAFITSFLKVMLL